MSELTTGGINFGYESPIEQIYKDVEYKFKEDMENKVMEAVHHFGISVVHHFGISVDKEELIKALQYDRNQYDKGYSDGRASIVEEFEKIKEKMEVIHNRYAINFQGFSMSVAQECIDIIDNEIAELKGENNGNS